MIFRLYYEKDYDEMLIDIMVDNKPVKQLQFKNVILKTETETVYFAEGHPRIAMVGSCTGMIIVDQNTLKIYS